MPKKKQSTPNVAVIYARYSSHAQKDASIEQQIAECTEYAQVANLQVIGHRVNKVPWGQQV